MRMIYLTLLFFVILGIGSNCRIPMLSGSDAAAFDDLAMRSGAVPDAPR